MEILSKKRRDFMRNAGLAAAATFVPGMTFSQKADAVEEELEKTPATGSGFRWHGRSGSER